jgi:UDP-N-acetyl-D-glucosamine dehydrogenase
MGADISYSDPYVPRLVTEGEELAAQPLFPSVDEADCVVIITDHGNVDYSAVVERAKLIFDTRNALRKIKSEKVIKL